jgi:dihydrofolate reductase
MHISLIAAMTPSRVIGNKGMIPWQRVPADMKHLKELAAGKTLILGSETMRSMIRYKSPLLLSCPVIVLTRKSVEEFREAGFHTAASLEQALSLLQDANASEVCILGGGQVYEEALTKSIVSTIHLTLIEAEVEGDTFFPELSPEAWQEVSHEAYPADEKNPYSYAFLTYKKR